MARESSIIVGSGLNPRKKALPPSPTDGQQYLTGTQSVIINPEDASAGQAIKSSSVLVGTSPTALPLTPLPKRRAMSIRNIGSAEIFIGNSAVSTTTGFPLEADEAISLELNAEVIVFAVVSGGTVEVRVLEVA